MPSWSIGNPERERVEVEILSPPDTSGWVNAQVRLSAGGFSGNFNLAIEVADVLSFRKELRRLDRDLRGHAEFRTIENQLGFKVEADQLGHVTVKGHAEDNAGIGNRLTFKLELDQTHLQRTLSE